MMKTVSNILKTFCNYLSKVGINENLSVYKVKKIIVFNRLNAFGFLVAVCWFFQNNSTTVSAKNTLFIVLNILPVIISVASFFLMNIKKYKAAINVNFILMPLALTVASIVIKEGSVLLYLVIYSVFPFFYNRSIVKMALQYSYVISLYAVSLYYFHINYTNNNFIFSPFLQVVEFLFLFATLFSVKIQVLAYEKSLRKNELKLDLKNEELQKLLHLKDQIFTVVSHDIMTPLVGLKNIVSDIIEEGEGEAELKQILPIIVDEINKTHNLFRNLLDWSKTQLEGRGNITTDVSLYDIACIATGQVNKQANCKAITIINEVDTDITANVNFDNFLLATRNLLINAVKFTAVGGVVTLNSCVENNIVQFNIKDTGVGISPEKMNSLFSDDLYTSPGTSAESGNGFGLKISKDLIAQNGGTVTCEKSVVGKGSVFSIKLPIGKINNAIKINCSEKVLMS